MVAGVTNPGPVLGSLGSGSVDASCVVCEFVEASVDRRIFFLFVEGLSEVWFFLQMRRGGFCLRHARHLSASGTGFRLTGPSLHVIKGWESRCAARESPDLTVGGACPVCETETWAEMHALGLLAAPDTERARVALGRTDPLCLRHLDQLIDRVPWPLASVVAARIDDRVRLAEATAQAGADPTIAILCGRDPDQPARPADEAPPDGDALRGRGPGWPDGSLTVEGLVEELEAGRCPVCSACRAASSRYLRWLGEPGRVVERDADLATVCRHHLYDACQRVPPAALRGIAASTGRWRAMAGVLVEARSEPPALVADRLRRAADVFRERRAVRTRERHLVSAVAATGRFVLDPKSIIADRLRRARLQRERRCAGCQAMVTAAGRTFDLVDALLAGRSGREHFERTDGFCLRHLAAGASRLQPSSAAIATNVARSRAARIGWELDEALRKSSWSVRYEPSGPENTGWKRALSFVLGEDVHATDFLAIEPDAERIGA